jgi:hypothetical protein
MLRAFPSSGEKSQSFQRAFRATVAQRLRMRKK